MQPQYVLRIFDNAKWLAAEPDLVTHEAAALAEAHRAGLAAPRYIAQGTRDAGFGAPVALMSFINGRVELPPTPDEAWLDGLATALAEIHRHKPPDFPWQFQSWVDKAALAPPSWSNSPAVWAEAIAHWQDGEPQYESVFLHRDYHPVNVLWQDGQVSGIVDWVNACRGPAGADVAHCRTNLALMYGPEAAQNFLTAYGKMAGSYDHDPYWDIDDVLNMCLPQPQYYEPWKHFGLGRISQAVLRQRAETHLAGALGRQF